MLPASDRCWSFSASPSRHAGTRLLAVYCSVRLGAVQRRAREYQLGPPRTQHRAVGIEDQGNSWEKPAVMFERAPLGVMLVATLCGCQSLGSVEASEVATASAKPSNVATMLTVTQHGQPVSSLSAAAFRLSENGQLLDGKTVDLRLIDPTRVATFHTVLLLDLTQTTTQEDREQFREAVWYFIRGVRAKQSVTVLGFDGAPKVRLLGEFPADTTGNRDNQLDKPLPAKVNPSRDLRSAVLQSLDLLDQRLQKGGQPLRAGTLVVFARGPDVAGRVPVSQVEARLNRVEHQLVFVNVAGDKTDDQTPALARNGQIHATAVESLPIAFEEAASAVEKLYGRFYVVSYCSPARGTNTWLRVEVQVVGDDLEVDSAEFSTSFDASNFTRGCNSGNPPRFERPKSAEADANAGKRK